MRWCDDGVLVLSSVAPSLVLYSVAPTHCLTLTIHCLTHTIFLSLTIRGNRLDALFRYPSNSFTHSSTLVIPHLITPMVSYYHHVTWCPTITKCSLTTCALIHFHPSSTSVLTVLLLVLPIIPLHTTRSTNHLSHGVHYLCSHRYPSYTSHLTWCPTTHRVIPDLLTLIECSLTLHDVIPSPLITHH